MAPFEEIVRVYDCARGFFITRLLLLEVSLGVAVRKSSRDPSFLFSVRGTLGAEFDNCSLERCEGKIRVRIFWEMF